MQALIEALLQLAATGVLALGGYAIHRAATWLKLREDGEVRAYLNDALERGVDLAVIELRATLAPYARPSGPAVENMVAKVSGYALERVPGALRHFGVTDDGLDDMIRSRLAARQIAQDVTPRAAG